MLWKRPALTLTRFQGFAVVLRGQAAPRAGRGAVPHEEPDGQGYYGGGLLNNKTAVCGLDPNSRITPALFFQPHFYNIVYQLRVDPANRTVLEAENYTEVTQSPIFCNFKYIKTFTPMRRFTTSHGATVRFMYESALEENSIENNEKNGVVTDAVMERILNRSFMVDPDDRLYKDSVLVRLEDGKLNPKATFTALAAFLDLPYSETMEYCSEGGEYVPYLGDNGYAPGFSPASIYRTYDDYVNDSERCFIEYFLRDAYAYYGYSFQYYDGVPVDEARVSEWTENFSTMDHYIRQTWSHLYREAKVYLGKERIGEEIELKVQDQLLENKINNFQENRLKILKSSWRTAFRE